VIAPGMKKAIPLILLMRSMGISTEARVFDLIARFINPSLHTSLLEFIRPSFIEQTKPNSKKNVYERHRYATLSTE
jgi:hypothetical protein